MLSIFEELFLLALDEERGTITRSAKKTIAYGLSGAILAELALQGKLYANEKHRLELIQDDPVGDEFLDGVLQDIRSSEKPRKLAYWIDQLSERPKKLRDRMGERLAAKGLLYQEDKRFYRQPPSSEEAEAAADTPAKFEIKRRLRAMILSTENSDLRSLALLNVAAGSELLNLIFTQDELDLAIRRIHEEEVHSALENPTMQTIEEIEQAIATSLDNNND
jgi:Golgi phosphoprotein 3